jgi:hypothetical protein
MRRWAIAVLVTVTAFIAFCPFEKTSDGAFLPLTVTIRSEAGLPIKSASVQALVDVQSATRSLDRLPPPAVTLIENSMYSVAEEPFLGPALTVKVPSSETTYRSLCWTHRTHFQYRGLLVVVEYERGLLGHVTEIPNLRETRVLTVEVP